MPPLRPCLGGLDGKPCGRLSQGTRCPDHARQRERVRTLAKRDRRPYTHSERVRRATVVEAHRATQGEVCPGWQRPSHPTDPANPLTADHPIAVAAGGSEQQSLSVLCRVCNGRKRAGWGGGAGT